MLNVLAMDAGPSLTDADDELVSDASKGSRAAWNQLVAKHRRRVLVVLMGDGHSLDAATEYAQEAWARIWAAHQHGKLERLELPGLVVTQARFVARDAFRRQKTREAMAAREAPEDPSSNTEAQVSTRQQLERLTKTLETLSAQHQRIFRLAQDDGVPHADIAARVGLSLQRVRQIIWEVRIKLRASLEDS